MGYWLSEQIYLFYAKKAVLFNSYVFIVFFLPIVVWGYFILARSPKSVLALVWLTLASLFFYAYWNIYYLPLLVISITVNYCLGRSIEKIPHKSPKSKGLMITGIVFNLGLLGYYKYSNFFVNSVNQFINTQFNLATIILPLAISFYSFTQIAYLVDAYQGRTKECNYNFLSYAFFVSFFPQLIAGPILRYNELLPQLEHKKILTFSQENLAKGVTLFILGLSKKVLIADNLSPWVAMVFDNVNDVSFLESWVGAFAYTFQLYFDFSGYSDMAIGLAWMFNLELPINFNSPYKATSIIDFWRRWHITLSHFLRDYLYIPLGGNRQGKVRQYVNLLITMLLGGLWHGAGWSFVVWGGIHGLFLVINNIWNKLVKKYYEIEIQILTFPIQKLYSFLGWFITFIAVIFTWVIFRAKTLQEGWILLQTMFGSRNFILPEAYRPLTKFIPYPFQFQGWSDFNALPDLGLHKTGFILVLILLFATLSPNTQELMKKFKPRLWVAVYISVLSIICLLSLNQVSEFLYFQF